MRIPQSFRIRYAEHLEIIHEVQRRAESRLRIVCARNHWLFDQRVKSDESVLAKLQLGALQSIEEVDDFYAAMVVVPTKREIEAAVLAVSEEFSDPVRQAPRTLAPTEFVYDDAHVLVRLGPLGPLDETGLIGQRRIEVQVRTGLQYAWWRATHDEIYKSLDDWQLQRLAAQTRGSIEQLDAVLADLPAAAKGIEVPAGFKPDEETAWIADWQQRWPADARPLDPKRFVETIRVFLDGAGIDAKTTERALDDETGQRFVGNPDLTPAQAVLLTLIELRGPKIVAGIRATGRYVLVTAEMEHASQALREVTDTDRVRLESTSDPGDG